MGFKQFDGGGGSGGGGGVAFSSITAGTNAAALVVGTGGSLTISGSGTVNATSLGGTLAASYALLANPTFTTAITTPVLNITQGTITADAPQISGTVTWNGAGIVGPAWKLNVTDTSSNAAALLMDFQVGGTSKFKVSRNGTITLGTITPDYFLRAGLIDFYADTSTLSGLVISQSNGAGIAINATTSPRIIMTSAGLYGWVPTTYDGIVDLSLYRDAANTLAQRNGTAAQATRWENTYTSGTNREYATADWQTVPNTFLFGTVKGSGGGTARAMSFMTDATQRWQIGATTGHLLAVTDNTYDIGASGANRPRSIYTSGGIFAQGLGFNCFDTGFIYWNTRSAMTSPADGQIKISNNAGSDFDRLQLGGTTSSFPAIKRSSAALTIRLADDSADADLNASHIITSATDFMHKTTAALANGAGAAAGTLLNAPAATNPTKWIPINDNGTTRYIPAW